MKPYFPVFRSVFLLPLVFVLVLATGPAAHDYGDPTPAEQAHLEAMNRARMDPHGEALRLGIDLFEGVPAGRISGNPVQPLVFNAQLLQAARLHSQDMIDQDFFSHSSLDGRSPVDRVEEAGYPYSTFGENIAFTGSTAPLEDVDAALQMHDALFLDENYPDRGHRVNILKDSYKEVGVGLGFGNFKGYPYSYMITCDFGKSWQMSESFLLGVVYDDQDGDRFYDAGEGIGGITIEAIGNETFTVATASAGGYGIPVSSGSYTLRATLLDGRTTQRRITVGDENVKVDFLLSDFGIVANEIGTSPGWITVTVSTDARFTFFVNVTHTAPADPAFEWLVVTAEINGIPTPVYALAGPGQLVDIRHVDSLASVGFDFGATADLYALGTFSMADIGLSSGDQLIYGYVYALSDTGDMVVENVVTIHVR